jgi:UDP-glucose 4-epimerase
MKKILITGNSGYIGSHLCKMLDGEYELWGLDLNNPQYKLEHHRKHDIRQALPENKNIFDAVIHLAALVSVSESESKPTDYYMTNFIGTLNVLKTVKCKNFIMASTGAAESCASAYGTSKRAAEDCVKEWCEYLKLPYTIFRFYNVIGSDGFKPTNPDGLMYNLMQSKDTGKFKIFGNDYTESWDGTCVRDYVHVNEICDALRAAIEKSSNKIECLGHGVGYTVKEMVNMFQLVNSIDIDVTYGPRREGDIPCSVLENVSPYMKNLYDIKDLLKIDK